MKLFSEILDDLNSPSTISGYMAATMGLMDMVYGVENKTKDEYIEMMEQYLTSDRNFLQDLTKYRDRIKTKAPRTIRGYLYTLKSVIEICRGEDFTKDKNKRFKNLLKGTRHPITSKCALTHSIIRSILIHATPPVRAACLTMAVSGIRIGELVQLRMMDFDLDQRKVVIPAFIAKTKERRITFLTEEATEAIKSWILYKPIYTERIKRQCTHIPPLKNTDRLFPMSEGSLREGIEIAIKNAGLEKRDVYTNRFTISPQSFRSFCATQLKNVMNADAVELILGHELPYSGAYCDLNDDGLYALYRKNEQSLYIGSDEHMRSTLNGVSGDIVKLREERDELKNDLNDMRKMILTLTKNFMNGEQIVATEIGHSFNQPKNKNE
jgi:integrase